MNEVGLNTNKISETIKWAFGLKKVSLKPDWSLIRFLGFDAIRNMQNIVNDKGIQASEYQLFFKNFTEFLNKELLNKELLAQLYKKNGDLLLPENEGVTFKLEGLEEKIKKKLEHAVYLKILTLLTNPSLANVTVSQVLQIVTVLEFFLNKSDFFKAVDVSAKMNAIYYCLIHTKPLETAKILVRLNDFDLLSEENLNKISANPQLKIILFTSVLDKLGLNGGTNSLLTQDNLDKLLQYPEFNLEILAKFIQVEDKSTVLTQEKFDIAIYLNDLLTLESIDKIEKTDFDPIKLADIFHALSESKILNQENFDQIVQLSKSNFETLFSAASFIFDENQDKSLLTQNNFYQLLNVLNVSDLEKAVAFLDVLNEKNILTQENFNSIVSLTKADFEKISNVQSRLSEATNLTQSDFDSFLETFLNTKKHDREQQNSPEDSLAHRFCAAILRVKVLTKNIFDKIIAFFNGKINLHNEKQAEEKENRNSFFRAASSSSSNTDNDQDPSAVINSQSQIFH
jgi:hypothetical protein